MGLVANVIEDTGIPTACLSMIPPLTRNTGAPRVVGLAYPMGLPFEWPERRSEAIREPDPAPPIARLLTRKPWLLRRLVSGRLP